MSRRRLARRLKPAEWPNFDRILLDQAMARGIDLLDDESSHEATFSGNVTHVFSSRLSSFRKRQSVPSARIWFGLFLSNSTSCRRSA